MPAKVPEQVRLRQIQSICGMTFVRWGSATYINNRTKAVMRCNACGTEWSAECSNLMAGKGCPRCAGNYRYTESERESQLNSLGACQFVKWHDGKYANKDSKADMRCTVCSFEWSASVNSLVNRNSACPRCAGNNRTSYGDMSAKINKIDGICFIEYASWYSGVKSRVRVRCARDGHEWETAIELLLRGAGCPKCAGNNRYNETQRISQINSIVGVNFVRWETFYKNKNSRATFSCDYGHEWVATINNVVNHGRKCRSCAQRGFDQTKVAKLYALVSACGSYIKIGISNNHARRIRALVSATPFDFNVAELITLPGMIARQLEVKFHRDFESAGFRGFDGATEWLKFDPNILFRLRSLGA